MTGRKNGLLSAMANELTNASNREATLAMFGIEAYQTLPGGKRRYLSVDEIHKNVRFTEGQFRYVEGDKVLPSDTIGKLVGGARTALPMLRSLYL